MTACTLYSCSSIRHCARPLPCIAQPVTRFWAEAEESVEFVGGGEALAVEHQTVFMETGSTPADRSD